MCRPTRPSALLNRHTNNFVQPPTQIDLMLNAFRQRTLGATFLSALAVCLGSYTTSNLVPSLSTSATIAAETTSSTASTFPFCSFLAVGLCLVGAAVFKLGKLHWDTVAECVHQVDEVVTRVSSSPTMAQIKSSISTSSMRLVELSHRWHHQHHGRLGGDDSVERRTLTISADEPFLSSEKMAELSLSDLKNLMRFALDNNRLDFRSKAFLSTLSPGAREAAEAIIQVVVESRGPKTALSTPSMMRGGAGDATADSSPAPGNMDALSFAAVARLFAEWRSLRLVPEGYQRYSVAMNLAKRDMIQNVQKLETSVHAWMTWQEGSRQSTVDLANGRQPTSPTLKQLLLWEKEQNTHTRLPRLAEKSGASGLLWIFRQLQYQTFVFQNLIQVPFVFPSAKQAVLAAYEATYNDYHGFLVKKVFQSSFDAAPGAECILAHMSRPSSEDIVDCHQEAVTEAMSEDEDSNSIGSSAIDSNETINVVQVAQLSPNPFEEVIQHIANEWMKLERFVKQCSGQYVELDPSRNILDTTSLKFVESSTALAKKASVATFASIQAAEEEIPSFIAAVEPVLRGLDEMIRELNMNDPSKC